MGLFDIFAALVAAVEQVLSDFAAGALFYLGAHGLAQVGAVHALRGDLNAYDGAAGGVGGQLHVDRGLKPPLGIFITRASASVVETRG